MSNASKAKKQNQFAETFRLLCRNKTAVLGLVIVVILALIAIFAPVVINYEEQVIKTNYSEALQHPSSAHWFGTDEMGRDIFIRVLYGSTTSLSIGLVTVIVALIGGLILGAAAGFYGGKVD
ncbi:MAG: ABC transporter permease, partial [Lachnospiraceae bacterium]|nr:ABC transporter permease [Lachnospiraceae bacterium]